MSSNRNLNDLPLEILSSISSFISDSNDIAAIQLASEPTHRNFKEADQYDLVWKKRCEIKFPAIYKEYEKKKDFKWRMVYKQSWLQDKFKKLEDFAKLDGTLLRFPYLKKAFQINDQLTLDHFFQLYENESEALINFPKLQIKLNKDKFLLHLAILCRQPIDKIKAIIEKLKLSCDLNNNHLGNISTWMQNKDFDKIKTPIALAVHMNQIEIVKLLLANGVDPNNYDNSYPSILKKAARNNNIEMVKILLNAGDEHAKKVINELDVDSLSFEILEVLLEKIKNILSLLDGPIQEHFRRAIRSGKLALVKIMVTKNIDINFYSYGYYSSLTQSPLYEALVAKQVEVANYLIANGAILTQKERAALPEFCGKVICSGNLEMMEILFQMMSFDKYSYLQTAIEASNVEMVDFLIRKGSFPSSVHLERAVERNDLKIATLLLNKEVNPNVYSRWNETRSPLYRAVNNGYLEMVQLLIEHNATKYNSCLSRAIEKDRWDIANVLNPAQALKQGSSQLVIYCHSRENGKRAIAARKNCLARVDAQPKKMTLYKLALIHGNKESIAYFQSESENKALLEKYNAYLNKQFVLWKENIAKLKTLLIAEKKKVENSWSLFKAQEINLKAKKIATLEKLESTNNFDDLVNFVSKQFTSKDKDVMSGWRSRVHQLYKDIEEGKPAENFSRELEVAFRAIEIEKKMSKQLIHEVTPHIAIRLTR